MDKILNMKKTNLTSISFCLLPTHVVWDNFLFLSSCWAIAVADLFGKMPPVAAIMYAIYLCFSAMDNDLLHASGLSP